MLDWASHNSQLISDVLNLGMLLVWIVYLHVIATGRRRQTRANILITVGSGSGLSARCLVSNMSAEAIYIHSIILRLETAEGEVNASVTEIDAVEGRDEPSDLNLWTRQGPLESGELRDLGTFDGMIEHALSTGSNGTGAKSALRESLRAMTVNVIAVYASEDLPVAAERSFDVIRGNDDKQYLRPEATAARQIRSRSQRRSIRRTLERDLRGDRHLE